MGRDTPPAIEFEEVMSSDEGVAKWTNLIVSLVAYSYQAQLTLS